MSQPTKPDELETPDEKRARTRSHIVCYISIFLYSVGFSITQSAIWPYLKEVCTLFPCIGFIRNFICLKYKNLRISIFCACYFVTFCAIYFVTSDLGVMNTLKFFQKRHPFFTIDKYILEFT